MTAASEDKKSKLGDLLAKAKLKRTETTDKREDDEFGWKSSDKDPNDPKAAITANLMAKQLKLDPATFKGMSSDDVKEVSKQLLDFREASIRAAKDGSGAKFQQTTVNMPDGTSAIAGYDTTTNQVTLSTLTNTGGGATKSYAPKYDATTGAIIPAVPGSIASPVKMPDGSKLSDTRTALEGERKYVKDTAGQQVKDEQDVQVADANVAKVDELEKSWLGLYDKAAKEGMFGNTGPVAGRLASAGAAAGFDMGEATNQADPQITREASNYIREQSGLQATDSEFKRLMSTIPTLGVEREIFIARMKAWKEDVKRTAEKARAKAAPVNGAAPTTTAAAPKAPTEVERKDKASGKIAVYDTSTSPPTFLRWKE